MDKKNRVEEVAHLARLQFSEEELVNFTSEFNRIVEMIEHLQEVDTEGVEPSYHGNQLFNVYREDVPALSHKRERFLANAPTADNGFIQVPVIIEDEEA